VILVASGLSTRIAARLYLSTSTAKTHATRAMAKLSGRDRAQLVVAAHESGLAATVANPARAAARDRPGRAATRTGP